MKHIVPIFLISVFFAFTMKDTFNSGIDFNGSSWRDVGKEAKTEGKGIFVMFCAPWCGKCAKMKESVFTDPEVGEYFNDKFINVLMDTEEPQNNIRATNWGVTSVPTVVFLDSRRNIVHKVTGFQDKADLMKHAGIALKRM